ncbi:MAG: oxygenase MpaB family protein, partial [Solirubrobacterales bacterium]
RVVGLTYGQRALLIGALDARNFVGTMVHSRYRDRPFKRLAATGKMFETVFFGTRAEADRVLAAVASMHGEVAGELGEDGGAFPPGTSYSAFDPDLMLWTIAVAADSAARFYELFVRELGAGERDAFWRDWVRFGELFGMPRELAPPSWGDFREWFDGRLAGEEMALTDEARRVGRGVAFQIPVPWVELPAIELHNLIMLGSLPPRVRSLYSLNWDVGREVAFRAATRAIRASRPLSPKRLARGRNGSRFDAVARVEATRIEAGRPPIPLAI